MGFVYATVMGGGIMSYGQSYMSTVSRAARQAIIPFILTACLLITGCSLKKVAVNHLGDALAGGGTGFARDDDPELIKAAVPFSLKLMESLLAEIPSHKGLLLASARGFTQYAFAFVELEAEELEGENIDRAIEMRDRGILAGVCRKGRGGNLIDHACGEGQ